MTEFHNKEKVFKTLGKFEMQIKDKLNEVLKDQPIYLSSIKIKLNPRSTTHSIIKSNWNFINKIDDRLFMCKKYCIVTPFGQHCWWDCGMEKQFLDKSSIDESISNPIVFIEEILNKHLPDLPGLKKMKIQFRPSENGELLINRVKYEFMHNFDEMMFGCSIRCIVTVFGTYYIIDCGVA